jgi:hypothetical protein
MRASPAPPGYPSSVTKRGNTPEFQALSSTWNATATEKRGNSADGKDNHSRWPDREVGHDHRGCTRASALAGGFSETGLEAWVRSLQAFAPEAEESQFQQVVNAANVVNYFETEEDQVAARKAKADALAAVKAGRRPKGESEPAAPAGA